MLARTHLLLAFAYGGLEQMVAKDRGKAGKDALA